MIIVTVGNNTSRGRYSYPPDTTLRTILEEQRIDYTKGGITLDGAQVGVGGLDKTLAAHGITEKCYLLQVIKADNAA